MALDPTHNASAAANTAAVVTLAAINYRSRKITGLDWSYSGEPVGGSIKIEDGAGNIVWGPMSVTSGGPGAFQWPKGMEGTPNTTMVVTLAAGGSGITGCIKVHVEV